MSTNPNNVIAASSRYVELGHDDTHGESGTSHLSVQRAIRGPGHCDIDDGVREAAAGDLVRWIETGTVPAGDDVLGDVFA